ncbi:hypothetical protein CPLU01_11995 [Colletotrichum plurivorum]|uniref:Kinesin light chain n=1 Tax=Colletotrichum plurivorum TaxID=2175906 RepID=A0A8H6N6T4_9PEZI|nr:hypothetical protein CPLU01_11995 [Colletotrichum plurivorum]
MLKRSGSLGRRAAKFEDVLRRKEEAFSDEHTHVLQSRSSLAPVWARQGRLAEAVEIHHNVLKTMKLQFGDAHPDTLTAMTDLAETLRWTGETVEAASWYGLVFDTKSKTFDKNAPEMIGDLSDYANSLLDGGETIEVQEKLAEVLRWKEEMLGHDYLHTVFPKNNPAVANRKQGKLEDAEEMLTTSYDVLDQLEVALHYRLIAVLVGDCSSRRKRFRKVSQFTSH